MTVQPSRWPRGFDPRGNVVRGSLARRPHACGARRAVLPDLRAKPSNVSGSHGFAGRVDHPLGCPRPAFVKTRATASWAATAGAPLDSSGRSGRSPRSGMQQRAVAGRRNRPVLECRRHTPWFTVPPKGLGQQPGRGAVTPDCVAPSHSLKDARTVTNADGRPRTTPTQNADLGRWPRDAP